MARRQTYLYGIGALSILMIGYVLYSFSSAPTPTPDSSSAPPAQQGQGQGPSSASASAPASAPVIVIQTDGQKAENPFVYENIHNLRNPPAQPFYYPTRGLPQPYQQYGVLIGEERRNMGEQTILPLIGRQTYPGSTRYHYYTTTNGYHPMKLPVSHRNRTCNDKTGCDEIYSGNVVTVQGYDYDFKADIYPSPDFQYIA